MTDDNQVLSIGKEIFCGIDHERITKRLTAERKFRDKKMQSVKHYTQHP